MLVYVMSINTYKHTHTSVCDWETHTQVKNELLLLVVACSKLFPSSAAGNCSIQLSEAASVSVQCNMHRVKVKFQAICLLSECFAANKASSDLLLLLLLLWVRLFVCLFAQL